MHLLPCAQIFRRNSRGIGVVSWAVPLPLLTSRFLREGALTPFRYRNVTFDEVKEVKLVLHELASHEAVALMRMEHRALLPRRLAPQNAVALLVFRRCSRALGGHQKSPS